MSGQMHGIVQPHDHDVLSGRGNFVNYHVGNEHFRSLVRKHKVAYVACPKPQKGKFSKMIVDEIRDRDPPGRFLKQDPRTKLWYDIGEKKALDKTRQALREGAPEIMKELNGEKEKDDPADDSGEEQGREGSSSPINAPQNCAQQVSNSVMMNMGCYGLENNQSLYDNYNLKSVSPDSLLSDGMAGQNALMSAGLIGIQPQTMTSTTSSSHQHISSSLSSQVMNHPGLALHQQQQRQEQDEQQQDQQQQQQQEQNLMLPPQHRTNRQSQSSRMGYPGVVPSSMQGNVHIPSYRDSDIKLTSLASGAIYDQLDPRPIDPGHASKTAAKQYKDQYLAEMEPVAPLPPSGRRVPLKLKRESSDHSLQVDNIFARTSAEASTDTKTKANGSSAHLSIMSLSLGDVHGDGTPIDLTSQASTISGLNASMPAIFNTSGFNTSVRAGRKPPHHHRRRESGTEYHHHHHQNMPDFPGGLDMSVATLGTLGTIGTGTGTIGNGTDRMSEYGELMDSHTNMSFGDVFDETDRDIIHR